jgi:hypothetical protein
MRRVPFWKFEIGKANLFVAEFLPNFVPGLTRVGSFPEGQLENDDSQRVKIRLVGVVALEKDLRGHVNGSAAGFGGIFEGAALDCDAEVSETQVAVFLENHVFGFNVLVDYFASVDIVESYKHAPRNKFYL